MSRGRLQGQWQQRRQQHQWKGGHWSIPAACQVSVGQGESRDKARQDKNSLSGKATHLPSFFAHFPDVRSRQRISDLEFPCVRHPADEFVSTQNFINRFGC